MNEDVLAVRKEILDEIGGRTLLDALAATAEHRRDEPAYSDRRTPEGGWRTLTWGELRETVLDVASGLVSLGIEHGDRLCIMGSNRLEHVLADMGALHAGAVPVTVYSTLSPTQVAWYARKVRPKVVVLEGATEL
ncbi:MAG: AMP-binding protein, partial [Nocardioides sp.]|nr:AMP-binding protein [Nocardioides sp.]